jgi:Arc/MetJ-type ribon-helix-helix transcriptional regulator
MMRGCFAPGRFPRSRGWRGGSSSSEIASTAATGPGNFRLAFVIHHPITIPMDGFWMVPMNMKIPDPRLKPVDSEKITINLGYVDLGHIDLLVQEGFFSNRTDFIRTAIRNQLDRHNDAVRQSVSRQKLDIGLRRFSREDLEAVRAGGVKLHIQVLGLAIIAQDVSPELAKDAIGSIHVLGALQASPAVKAALSDRLT